MADDVTIKYLERRTVLNILNEKVTIILEHF